MKYFLAFFTFVVSFQSINASEPPENPNIIVLITDQERFPVHWPEGWVEEHLPSNARLKKNGLTYYRAYTSASMCSPSRAVLLTSQFAPVTDMYTDLSTVRESPTLPTKEALTNLASLIQERTDYEVVWKGKWHLSYAVDGLDNWSAKDIPNLAKEYGPWFWNPPDSGNAGHESYVRDKTFALSTLGGGYANNDGRYLRGPTKPDPQETPGWGHSILSYLEKVGQKPKDERKPFCLFISFVNPHDIWVNPIGWEEAGYKLEDFAHMGIDLPSNFKDSLQTKPSVQLEVREMLNQVAPFTDPEEYVNYVNFYAYLHTVVDKHIMTLLDALEHHQLLEDTIIIRTSDHGELGLSHGMREKAYTVYEEEIHIPLIISNPQLFENPRSTEAFYSHVDLVPTLIDFLGLSLEEPHFQGVSQYPVILEEIGAVRDSVIFAFDDVYLLPADTPNSHIRCIREDKWTYAVYFSLDGKSFEYELYDLESDPWQLTNLLYGENIQTHRHIAAYLHERLTKQMAEDDALSSKVPWPSVPW